MTQTSLFGQASQTQHPLAFKLSPKTFDDYLGQEHLLAPDKPLRKLIESDKLISIILWGPPGCGKTGLSRLISQKTNANYIALNAVTAKISDIKDSIEAAKTARQFHNKRTLLFIDEIHRFNKTQQDALLPEVENGLLTLIGATTENPFFSVIPALISRCQLFELKPLTETHLKTLIQKTTIPIEPEAQIQLIHHASGDARKLLNLIETLQASSDTSITTSDIEALTQVKGIAHNETTRYDIISAFIKSMRASNEDDAIYWLARLITSNEDPAFIARRLIVFASEDIGNADPQALPLATALIQAVQNIGMPEIRINLSQVTSYMAKAPKSRTNYTAINSALAAIHTGDIRQVPDHLKNR